MFDKLASLFASLKQENIVPHKEEECVGAREKTGQGVRIREKTGGVIIPGLTDVIFSWSLADVLNRDLLKDKVPIFLAHMHA